MIGEASEKTEIDEETVLEPDPRLLELSSLFILKVSLGNAMSVNFIVTVFETISVAF